MYLLINSISLVFSRIGILGVLSLDLKKISIHAIVTSSIIGMFFFFQILEVFFRRADPNDVSKFLLYLIYNKILTIKSWINYNLVRVLHYFCLVYLIL